MKLFRALVFGGLTVLMMTVTGIVIVGLSCQCDFLLDHDSWSPRYNVLATNAAEITSLVVAIPIMFVFGNWTVQALREGTVPIVNRKSEPKE